MTQRKSIEACLDGDARVADVRLREDGDHLVVQLRPARDWVQVQREAAHAALSQRMLSQWRMVYDKSYRRPDMVREPNFDAWVSSFTGQPIPICEMRIWLDHALAEMRRVPHRRVLEVGCGVGLIVAALAPGGLSYHAVDFSEEGLAALGAWAATQPALAHVRLALRAAHELESLGVEPVELAILNSVVQYFPDADYLREALAGTARHVATGGAIFLGDLRAPALLRMRAACVAAGRAEPDATVADVRASAQAILTLGRELAVDPAFLTAAQTGLGRVGNVRFALKPPGTDRGLSGYRYDAMLHLDTPVPEVPRRLSARSLDESLAALDRDAPDAILLEGLPNARLAGDLALMRALRDAAPGAPLREIEAHVRSDPNAIEPFALAEAVAARGYDAELRLTPGSPEGCFDALVRRPETAAGWAQVEPAVLTNDPLGDELATKLRRDLQSEVDRAVGRGVARVELTR